MLGFENEVHSLANAVISSRNGHFFLFTIYNKFVCFQDVHRCLAAIFDVT